MAGPLRKWGAIFFARDLNSFFGKNDNRDD
jgi:hypothetical protein